MLQDGCTNARNLTDLGLPKAGEHFSISTRRRESVGQSISCLCSEETSDQAEANPNLGIILEKISERKAVLDCVNVNELKCRTCVRSFITFISCSTKKKKQNRSLMQYELQV